jgi:hypothetical protein
MPENNGNRRSSEADRYREAATQALEMLDWCIGYLVGVRKEGIAARLAENRSYIRKQLMKEPAEPLPTSKE